MEYTIIETPYGEAIQGTDGDGLIYHIPNDPANSDYQAYLKSLEPEIVEEPVVEEPPVEDVPAEDIPVTD